MTVTSRAHKNELRASRGQSRADEIIGSDLPEAEISEERPSLFDIQATSIVAQVPEELYDAEELEAYLFDELTASIEERGELIADIARWKEVYFAPDKGPKNWPFEGASNITVPVAMEMVDTTVSAISQSLLVPEPTWILKRAADEWRVFKSSIETWMDLAGRRELKMHEKIHTMILEGSKLGTSIIEESHEILFETFYIYDQEGKKASPVEREVKSGPVLWNVPLQDFYIRFYETDIQEADWCAKSFELNRTQLRNRGEMGYYDSECVDFLLGDLFLDGDGHYYDDATSMDKELQHTEPITLDNFKIFQVWCRWLLEDDLGNLTHLQIYYHMETGKILSVRFHPYRHGRRPFHKYVHKVVENQFYGQGIPSMIEQLQKEISTQHNQRTDNATIANMKMWSVRRGSNALLPGDPLYMNKVVERDAPDDVIPMQAGEVYPSTYNNEQISRTIVERVVGISDANTRGGYPVSRTTATAQMALLQEQAKRLDTPINMARKVISDIGNMTLELYFQFGAGNKPIAWMGKRGAIVKAIFEMPVDVIDTGIGLEASAPTSQLNRETQKQNYLALYNLTTQLYTSFVQLMQGLQPPVEVMATIVGALATSAEQFMHEVLDQFEVTNPDKILSGLQFLQRILPSPEDLGGLESFERSQVNELMFQKLGELEDSLRQAVGIKAGEISNLALSEPPKRSEQVVRVERRQVPSGIETRDY